jgi:hypothetical protein
MLGLFQWALLEVVLSCPESALEIIQYSIPYNPTTELERATPDIANDIVGMGYFWGCITRIDIYVISHPRGDRRSKGLDL